MARKLLVVSCLPAILLLALSGCESVCKGPGAGKSSSTGTTAVNKPAQPAPAVQQTPPAQPKPSAPSAPTSQTPKPAPAPQPGPAIVKGNGPAFKLRVNCAATEPYTDKAGNLWVPDQEIGPDKAWGADDGMTIDRGDVSIPGTDAPRVYQLERYSMPAYRFTVPNGKYTVRLHFAETYEGITEAGQRVFSVNINDNVVLPDFDVFKAAGGFQKPVVKEFKGITVTNEKLFIGFTPKVENPEINGIEIFSE